MLGFSEKPKKKPEQEEEISRRDFLRGAKRVAKGAAATAALATPVGMIANEAIAGQENIGGAIIAPPHMSQYTDQVLIKKSILVAKQVLSRLPGMNGQVFYPGEVNREWSDDLAYAIDQFQKSDWYNDEVGPGRDGVLDEKTFTAIADAFHNSVKK